MYTWEDINKVDPVIAELIQKEFERQNSHIELIASENWTSPAVTSALGTCLTNKYAEGYPGRRYYGGCEVVDQIESIAIERAKKLFGCTYANVQPHSGAQANFAVFYALLQPGDTFMGMSLDEGGHLTHGSPANVSGNYFNAVPYGVDENGFIDYDACERIAKECRPKLIVAGASAERVQTEADRRRCFRLLQNDRFQETPQDRRFCRRLSHGRYGSYRGPCRDRVSSEPDSVRGCDDDDHAQDAPRTERRYDPLKRGVRESAFPEQRHFPGDTGRSADALHRSESCHALGRSSA